MVKSWAPEPPEERDDQLPVVSSEHLIFPQSEDDSDDMQFIPDAPTGYTLFPNADIEDHSNADTDDSDDSTSVGHAHAPASSEMTPQSETDTHSQALPTSSSGNEEVCRLFNAPRPATMTELVIDCEQVREAMATVTLPPSAFPPWAVGVSDSELTNHIQRLLNKATPTEPSTAVRNSE
ncbi:uncharacterized protein LOC111044913 [Nilaparvata lugens]|uniref:uncharacterized protein LOC111044913 n=1 Tax=Nilaparvata lugens TaxID=108931 RepID=UPI00193DF0C5|nr:uncharacterized protein LOC111044913 [Nilaparvata lugens]